jgi:phasin family protein
MQTDVFKNFEELNKATMDSAKRLGDLQLRTFEKLAELEMEAVADFFQGGMKQLQVLGESKDLQAAFKEQARYTGEVNDKLIGHSKKAAEVLSEVKADFTGWVEDGMKAAGKAV